MCNMFDGISEKYLVSSGGLTLHHLPCWSAPRPKHAIVPKYRIILNGSPTVFQYTVIYLLASNLLPFWGLLDSEGRNSPPPIILATPKVHPPFGRSQMDASVIHLAIPCLFGGALGLDSKTCWHRL